MTEPGEEMRGLGLARIAFGVIVLFRTTPLLALLHLPYAGAAMPLLGWPTPSWHVAALGLTLPPSVVACLCVARTLAVILFTLGVLARPAGIAGGVLGWAVLSQDAFAYVNTLHLLFLGLVILGTSGAGSVYALRPEPECDPPSGLALARALVVSVYAWSGIAKLNSSWLRGEALNQLRASGVDSGLLANPLLASAPGRVAAAWAVVTIELSLGPLLLWRRTRRYAVVAALALHFALEVSVHPDVFGFAMAALLLAFVDPPGLRTTGTPAATQPSGRAIR